MYDPQEQFITRRFDSSQAESTTSGTIQMALHISRVACLLHVQLPKIALRDLFYFQPTMRSLNQGVLESEKVSMITASDARRAVGNLVVI
jgi:hypothetical protein